MKIATTVLAFVFTLALVYTCYSSYTIFARYGDSATDQPAQALMIGAGASALLYLVGGVFVRRRAGIAVICFLVAATVDVLASNSVDYATVSVNLLGIVPVGRLLSWGLASVILAMLSLLCFFIGDPTQTRPSWRHPTY